MLRMCVSDVFFFFFKQKTAYEIGTGDWSSDVCSSDLGDFRQTVEKIALFKIGDPEPLQPEDIALCAPLSDRKSVV